MNKIIDLFKRSRLAKIAIVFLAGAILFINTACSSTPTTMAKSGNSNYPDQPRPSDNNLFGGGDTQRTRRENPPSYSLDPNMRQKMKETYTPTAPKAGMNQGLDQDVRDKDNLAATQKKTERRVTQARENIVNKGFQFDNGRNPIDNLREQPPSLGVAKDNLDRAADSVGDSANEMRKGAARGFQNLKRNVGDAIDNAS